jgi:TolB-like protein
MATLQFFQASRLALTLATAGASMLSFPSRARAQDTSTDRRASVVMLDFNVAALRDPAVWAPLAKGIPHILTTELSTNPDLRIVERERLQAVLDELKLTQAALVDPATAARVGKIIGARYLVHGNITIDPNKKLRLDVHGFKVETTVHEHSQSLSGTADDVLELVAQLGQRVSKDFDPTPFDAPAARNSSNEGRPTREGLRVAMLLGNAVDLRDRKDVEGAKVLVRQALALAPGNPSAVAMLTSLEHAKE